MSGDDFEGRWTARDGTPVWVGWRDAIGHWHGGYYGGEVAELLWDERGSAIQPPRSSLDLLTRWRAGAAYR